MSATKTSSRVRPSRNRLPRPAPGSERGVVSVSVAAALSKLAAAMADVATAILEETRSSVRSEMTQAHGERMVKVAEACEILGVGETTLRELVASGRLKAYRISRLVRFRRGDLGPELFAPAVEAPRSVAMRLVGVRHG